MRSSSGEIALPPLHEPRLENGLRLVVAPRAGIPLVAVRVMVAVGSANDPPGRHGLAHLLAHVARRGTARRSGREIDDRIESLGAELGAGADEDATYFGLSAPSEFLAQLLDVVADVVTGPVFPPRELERVLRREVAGLAHLLDEPGAVADRAMIQGVYRGHAYGHPADGRQRHLRSVKRSDAVAFHQRWYGPANTTLLVVGAVDPQETVGLARRRLGRWRVAAAEPPRLAPAAPVERSVLVVDKPDLTQVQVRIAAPALRRATPDYFPAVVGNAVLGGGFTSRLMEAVRVNRGLTYSVRSRFAMSRWSGLFFAASFTKVESAGDLVQVILDEMERFAADGPREEEMERAKSYLSGVFPLSLETHEQVAERLADMRLYGIPLEEVTGYCGRVRAVTAEQCREVARRHLPLAGRGVIVAVGPARRVAPALERFGPVQVVAARTVV